MISKEIYTAAKSLVDENRALSKATTDEQVCELFLKNCFAQNLVFMAYALIIIERYEAQQPAPQLYEG